MISLPSPPSSSHSWDQSRRPSDCTDMDQSLGFNAHHVESEDDDMFVTGFVEPPQDEDDDVMFLDPRDAPPAIQEQWKNSGQATIVSRPVKQEDYDRDGLEVYDTPMQVYPEAPSLELGRFLEEPKPHHSEHAGYETPEKFDSGSQRWAELGETDAGREAIVVQPSANGHVNDDEVQVVEPGAHGQVDDDEVQVVEPRADGASFRVNHDAVYHRLVRSNDKKNRILEKEARGELLSQQEQYTLRKLVQNIQQLEAQVNQHHILEEEEEEEDVIPLGDQPGHFPNVPESSSKSGKRPSAKSAEEWWAREYGRKQTKPDSQTAVAKRQLLFNPGGRDGGGKRRKAGQNAAPGSRRFFGMLRDEDPIMARAAMGDIPMPGPLQASTKIDQLRLIKEAVEGLDNKGGAKSTARAEYALLAKAHKSFGHGCCKAQNNMWLLKGINTPLYHHQLVGVHWMLGKEFSPDGAGGGILADQMGLGKTLQLLACVSQNRPPPRLSGDGSQSRATLIVAPASAIPQWKSEIKKHCHHDFSKHYHYRASANPERSRWINADFVIVSYYEVINAYPSEDTLKRISGLNDDEWAREMDKVLGDLFRVTFHRVVLDEAHAIKNPLSRTSIACTHLGGKHRWALTGTPILNNVDELFPYLKFLGVEWAVSPERFKEEFGELAEDTIKARLAAVVPHLMIRRRVHDFFMGKPILQIPATHPVQTVIIDLSDEERLIYRRLESRFRDNINSHTQEGMTKVKMRSYFEYLTRLRQATAHPFLLESCMRKNFTLEDMDWLRFQLAEIGCRTPLHRQISRWMDAEGSRRRPSQSVDPGADNGLPENEAFGSSDFGKLFDMSNQLKHIQMEKQNDPGEVFCRACYEIPELAEITPCGHSFHPECIENLVQRATKRGKIPQCPACGNVIRENDRRRLLQPADTDAAEGKGPSAKGTQQADKKQGLRRPGDDYLGVQPKATEASTFLACSDKDPHAPVTPSAKTTAIKRVVLEWLKEHPDDKIIIFTQYITLARVLGRMLNAEDIDFLYYFGGLDGFQKGRAIEEFGSPFTPVRVLLASVRCGGQALNLTAANRVILVDLWWNSAMERQAFGRVHRIGQLKETYYVKIVTCNTIDQRLLDMQNEKDAEIDAALQDDKPPQLSKKDAARLMGLDKAATVMIDSDSDSDDDDDDLFDDVVEVVDPGRGAAEPQNRQEEQGNKDQVMTDPNAPASSNNETEVEDKLLEILNPRPSLSSGAGVENGAEPIDLSLESSDSEEPDPEEEEESMFVD